MIEKPELRANRTLARARIRDRGRTGAHVNQGRRENERHPIAQPIFEIGPGFELAVGRGHHGFARGIEAARRLDIADPGNHLPLPFGRGKGPGTAAARGQTERDAENHGGGL